MKDHSSHALVGWAASIIFFAFGFYCAFYPHKLQQEILSYYARNAGAEQRDPFSSWIKSRRYVSTIRWGGIVLLATGVFLLLGLGLGYNPLPTW